MSDIKPIIGITIGDYNGIGVEVILKALENSRILNLCTPIIYGSMKIISRYRKLMSLPEWQIIPIQNANQVHQRKTNIININAQQNFEVQPGNVTPEAGLYAYQVLAAATEDLKTKKIDALVTAPINKHNIQNEKFNFPGHTEYFESFFPQLKSLMFMVSEFLKVAVVTGHIPLKSVSQQITAQKVADKLIILNKSLRLDFGIPKPKIAVLGLNPHAGEDGLLGDEEQKMIRPVIIELKKKGSLVFGPYSADSFFGTQEYKKYDAVLAMYHDQGLLPFKTIAFENGVNFTAGLPIVRTSPDHGTAYDIAGKNVADETSMREAIFTAIEIVKARKEYLAASANALNPSAANSSLALN